MEKKKHQTWGIITVIAICIAIVSSIVSIYSSFSINNNLNIISVHPFAVSNALNKVKISVASERIRLSRLITYNEAKDVEIVEDSIKALHEENDSNMSYITQFYLGPAEDAQELNHLLEMLYDKEVDYLNGASARTLQENEEYIEQNFNVLYDDIDATSNTIAKFAENTVMKRTASSNATLALNIVVSLLISAMLILLAILYQRLIMKKINDQETYYRDFLFKILSENIDTVFMIYNIKKHEMEFVSSNTDRILGIDNRELEEGNIDIFDYCDNDECKELEKAFKSEVLQMRSENEFMMTNPKGQYESCMKFIVYPIQEDGMINRYIISITDQTSIKKNQQVLRDALINAQNANKAKSDFLSRMSHEIRTPMNAIIGMCTIAEASQGNAARINDCLTKIMKSSKHLLLLINDILDMSKIESGKLTLSKQPFILEDVISNTSSIIYNQAKEKNQSFEVTGLVTHEELLGDSLRVNQILINLLSNAVKYTPEYGVIRLDIKEISDPLQERIRLRFTIKDNGIGMSKEFQERVFQPFEQEGQMTGGTGLGLAITKNLVTLSNGIITVHSEIGQGSEFIVDLPFYISGLDNTPVITKEFDNLKALIVDDDKVTCEHVSIILNRLGVQNDWVLSGRDGIDHTIDAYYQHETYDVVFMDWKMPDIDGIEATKQIRKVVGPDTLIIIISAVNWSEIEEEARLAGANDFITKPMFQSSIYNVLLHTTKATYVSNMPAEQQQTDFTGKRFLVVEDNALNLEIAEELLKMVNATIVTAENGKLGLDCFVNSEQGFFDAILMDVQMPVMDGYEATRMIRASSHPQAKAIPIIAMTANAFSEDISAAMHAGMNAHLAKPIDIDILFNVISQQINGQIQERKDLL